MIGYQPCPKCGSVKLHEVKKWEPDDGDPRASWCLSVECKDCGFNQHPNNWNSTPKHIALVRAEKAEEELAYVRDWAINLRDLKDRAEAERDEARKLVTDFCIAANTSDTASIITATFHMNQAQREWK